ncbi:MAG: DUF167 family protein [Thiohalocapsa sp.]
MRLTVRLAPRARGDHIDGLARLADGSAVVKASVRAPPADNRANEALLQLLAREWRLPRRELSLVGGGKSRTKTVQIAGPSASVLARLREAVAALPQLR